MYSILRAGHYGIDAQAQRWKWICSLSAYYRLIHKQAGMGKQIAFTVCLALSDEPNLLSKLLSQLYTVMLCTT